MPQITIFCDGSCDVNTRQGGWAAILIADNARRHIANWELDTTISRMELKAAIEALKAIRRAATVTVYSDSEYVIKGMNEAIRLQNRQRQRLQQKEIKNDDLWLQLEQITAKHSVTWIHVRGHQSVTDKLTKYNTLADKLAGQARTLQRPLNELHVRDK